MGLSVSSICFIIGVVKHHHSNNKLKKSVVIFQDQLGKIENLYQESEKQRHEEAERRKEAAQHIVRLTEMKNMLQHQLDNGSAGTVTEKQVRSSDMLHPLYWHSIVSLVLLPYCTSSLN
jgi:hypothetical protein